MLLWSRSRFRLSIWIAVFAVLLTAIMPAVSRAVAAQDGFSWQEVCTADGVGYAVIDSSTGETVPVHSILDGCCFYCHSHAGSFALLPLDGTLFQVAGFFSGNIPVSVAAPWRSSTWVIASPRGPPAASV